MKLSTDIKIEELKQADLDALIAAYNVKAALLDQGRSIATRMMMEGLGVEMNDPRFAMRLAAHRIMNALSSEHETGAQ